MFGMNSIKKLYNLDIDWISEIKICYGTASYTHTIHFETSFKLNMIPQSFKETSVFLISFFVTYVTTHMPQKQLGVVWIRLDLQFVFVYEFLWETWCGYDVTKQYVDYKPDFIWIGYHIKRY